MSDTRHHDKLKSKKSSVLRVFNSIANSEAELTVSLIQSSPSYESEIVTSPYTRKTHEDKSVINKKLSLDDFANQGPVIERISNFLLIPSKIAMLASNKNLSRSFGAIYYHINQVNDFFNEDIKSLQMANSFLTQSKKQLERNSKKATDSFRYLGLLMPELSIDYIIDLPLKNLQTLHSRMTGYEMRSCKNCLSINLKAQPTECIMAAGCCVASSAAAALVCTGAAIVSWQTIACIAQCFNSSSIACPSDGGLCTLTPLGKLVTTITSSAGAVLGCGKAIYCYRDDIKFDVAPEHIEKAAHFTRNVIVQRHIEKSVAQYKKTLEDESKNSAQQPKKREQKSPHSKFNLFQDRPDDEPIDSIEEALNMTNSR